MRKNIGREEGSRKAFKGINLFQFRICLNKKKRVNERSTGRLPPLQNSETPSVNDKKSEHAKMPQSVSSSKKRQNTFEVDEKVESNKIDNRYDNSQLKKNPNSKPKYSSGGNRKSVPKHTPVLKQVQNKPQLRNQGYKLASPNKSIKSNKSNKINNENDKSAKSMKSKDTPGQSANTDNANTKSQDVVGTKKSIEKPVMQDSAPESVADNTPESAVKNEESINENKPVEQSPEKPVENTVEKPSEQLDTYNFGDDYDDPKDDNKTFEENKTVEDNKAESSNKDLKQNTATYSSQEQIKSDPKLTELKQSTQNEDNYESEFSSKNNLRESNQINSDKQPENPIKEDLGSVQGVEKVNESLDEEIYDSFGSAEKEVKPKESQKAILESNQKLESDKKESEIKESMYSMPSEMPENKSPKPISDEPKQGRNLKISLLCRFSSLLNLYINEFVFAKASHGLICLTRFNINCLE